MNLKTNHIIKAVALLAFILLSFKSNAQNDLRARVAYEDAENAFNTQNFERALAHLENAKELLNGENPTILYLQILVERELCKKDTGYFAKIKQTIARIEKLPNYGVFSSEKRMEIYRIESKLDEMKKKTLNSGNAMPNSRSKAPAFTYTNYNGGTTSLNQLAGTYVYISIWASWAGPFNKEIPFIIQHVNHYQNANIAFVNIAIDNVTAMDRWKAKVRDSNVPGINLLADKSWSSGLITSLGINAVPHFVLIDPDGRIVASRAIAPSDPAFRQKLEAVLNEGN